MVNMEGGGGVAPSPKLIEGGFKIPGLGGIEVELTSGGGIGATDTVGEEDDDEVSLLFSGCCWALKVAKFILGPVTGLLREPACILYTIY